MTSPSSVWLYGSHARGDADRLSDIDLLVLCDDDWTVDRVASVFPISEEANCSISRYAWSEFRMMAGYGSLFLHHIRVEGVLLCETPDCGGVARDLLDGLSPYTHARRDVEAFRTVLSDVQEELALGSSIPYELAILGTVIRHASVLGCYLLERPCFGRSEPVRRFAAALDLPSAFAEDFPIMYRYRLALDQRRCKTPSANRKEAIRWLNCAERIVTGVGVLCNEER